MAACSDDDIAWLRREEARYLHAKLDEVAQVTDGAKRLLAECKVVTVALKRKMAELLGDEYDVMSGESDSSDCHPPPGSLPVRDDQYVWHPPHGSRGATAIRAAERGSRDEEDQYARHPPQCFKRSKW